MFVEQLTKSLFSLKKNCRERPIWVVSSDDNIGSAHAQTNSPAAIRKYFFHSAAYWILGIAVGGAGFGSARCSSVNAADIAGGEELHEQQRRRRMSRSTYSRSAEDSLGQGSLATGRAVRGGRSGISARLSPGGACHRAGNVSLEG